MYQTDPKTFRTIRNSSNMLAINNYKKKKKKIASDKYYHG